MSVRNVVPALLLLVTPVRLAAQLWNGEETAALVARAIARRAESRADSGLRDYRARAHGFVFFLGQFGEGLAEPPRLIKSDELVLQVYWRTPGRSKQRIVGWRDRVDLPTDIRYHRDHLGIVQNNFADRIRLGQGDEVRDVPHPLSPRGPELYDYALVDSVTLRLPRRAVRVFEVLVRPKERAAPRVLGRLYIDVASADLVIFRFNFSRAAYLDDTLEDITVVLENGLWEGRYWLPRRQEIEIRRRTRWLDLPARGIIRGRWEIEAYEFNVGPPDSLFWGPEIVALPRAVRDTFGWTVPLPVAVREVAGPVMTFDLEAVRAANARIAGDQVLSGLAVARPSVGAISDILHFNRVEGLTPGAGWVFRPGGVLELRGWAAYGIRDHRLKAELGVRYRTGPLSLGLKGTRRIRDIGDEPVIAPLVNSLTAQELGNDYGDYVLLEAIRAAVSRNFGALGALTVAVGIERPVSVAVRASPAHGTFRANPALGGGPYRVASLAIERRNAALSVRGGVSGRVAIEGGEGDGTRYLRARGTARLHLGFGGTRVVARGWAGWGSGELPAHRSFVLGGRGTLVSEPFRQWGGRYAAFGQVEWRLPVPFPALPLGPFVSTGREIVVAPYVSVGWAGGPLDALPWVPTGGVRPVVGLGIEWFHRLVRADIGVGLRDSRVGVVVDLRRDLWGIL